MVLLIDQDNWLTEDEKKLYKLRKYRNSWVHVDRVSDTLILINENPYLEEEMVVLSIGMLLIILFSSPFIQLALLKLTRFLNCALCHFSL